MGIHYLNTQVADDYRQAEADVEFARVKAAAAGLLCALRKLSDTAEEVRDDPLFGDMHVSEWIDALQVAGDAKVPALRDMR